MTENEIRLLSLKAFICRYCLIIAAFLCFLWAILQGTEQFDTVPTLDTLGKYAIFDIERIPRCQIYQVIAQDGKVYLLYEAKGLVNVYTSGGTFLYALQVCSYENGRAQMALKDGVLYVESRNHMVYQFRDGQFLESFYGVATNAQEKAEVRQRYREIQYLMDEPQSQTTDGITFSLSWSQTKLFAEDQSTGLKKHVDWLPTRNPAVAVVKILLIIVVALWSLCWPRKR